MNVSVNSNYILTIPQVPEHLVYALQFIIF